MEKPYWRTTALAIATAVLLSTSAFDAHALALGRINVQSGIGEPLRAEIDIPEINAEELASLRTTVASPEAFRAAGLEYFPGLSSIVITLERRSDGRHFLRLSSSRPVNEPFVDLLLETSWSSGRIVRDYTLLFDPPNLRQNAPPLAAQVPQRAPRRAAAPAAAPSAGPSTRAPAARLAPTPAPAPSQAASAAPPAGDGKQQVTVKAGDTAGKIASASKPANVSLDQMLVALLRANPDAFIGGNVNRLRSGAVLEVPSGEAAAQVAPGEARQAVVAQSRDFNEFRRRLAEGLPTTGIGASDRQASGKIQAQVEDKKAGAAAPDKLTLSKGAAQGKAAEDNIARDRAAQDAATRVAELNKNISDLNKLGTTPASSATGQAATAAAPAGGASTSRPGIALPLGSASTAKSVPAPSPAPTAAPAAAAAPAVSAVSPASPASASAPVASTAVTAASAPEATAPVSVGAVSSSLPPTQPAETSPPTAAASAPAIPATTTASAPKAAAVAPVETSLVDDLLENPIVPATIGGLLALLLGFGFYRAQQRKKSTQVDSSFLESRLQPDSFFGASGGQRIDTNEGGATGSSLVYSPSQLDAAGDVDPVAEADVYLAYGRDLQAEEILKEAMRTTPQRVAIHSKLLEIYSKRRDTKAFEVVANEAHGLTSGAGPEWEHICEMGRELDPTNSLYRPGGEPVGGSIPAAAAAGVAAAGFGAAAASTQPMPAAADLDLDLDFSIGDDEPAPAAAPIARIDAPAAAAQPSIPSLDMDFGGATASLEAPMLPPSQPEPARLGTPDLMLDENSLSFSAEPPVATRPTAPAHHLSAPAAPATDAGMIEFDMGALSLDLDSPPATASAAEARSDAGHTPISTAGAPLMSVDFDDSADDPLATKLALAEEFNAIGDPDGARSLAQEVLAEASGDLKSRAQRFLAEIS